MMTSFLVINHTHIYALKMADPVVHEVQRDHYLVLFPVIYIVLIDSCLLDQRSRKKFVFVAGKV